MRPTLDERYSLLHTSRTATTTPSAAVAAPPPAVIIARVDAQHWWWWRGESADRGAEEEGRHLVNVN